LRSTSLPLPPVSAKNSLASSRRPLAFAQPAHDDPASLAEKTAGMDFRVEDHVDAARFNLILWQAMKGENVPYPTVRTGMDLRKNRETLLKHWRESRTKA